MHFFVQGNNGINFFFKKSVGRGHLGSGGGLGPGEYFQSISIPQRIQILLFLSSLNPLTPKISLIILLTVSLTVLVMLVWRIWSWIFLDILLYSHHLSA